MTPIQVVITPYHTFWRRFWAGIVDGLVLSPLGFVEGIVNPQSHGPQVILAWSIVQAGFVVSYSVLMHAKYGQTLGKMALSVIVLDNAEQRIPTLREAALRDIGEIGPAVLSIGFLGAAILGGEATAAPYDMFQRWLVHAGGWWFLIEIVTMMTNSRRRALHDYIAGTVVMRKDDVPVGVVDGIGRV